MLMHVMLNTCHKGNNATCNIDRVDTCNIDTVDTCNIDTVDTHNFKTNNMDAGNIKTGNSVKCDIVILIHVISKQEIWIQVILSQFNYTKRVCSVTRISNS